MNLTNAVDWLNLIMLGGLAGMLGQGARVIVGLKKAQDAASAANQSLSNIFDVGRLLISLVIGFIAGGIAAIQSHTSIDQTQILAYVAVGYIGVDFIEGFIRRTQPAENASVASGRAGADDSASTRGRENDVLRPASNEGPATDDAVG